MTYVCGLAARSKGFGPQQSGSFVPNVLDPANAGFGSQAESQSELQQMAFFKMRRAVNTASSTVAMAFLRVALRKGFDDRMHVCQYQPDQRS